ncbi:LOW QUALITY PROTEIN: putative taste receptor type 2 member 36 [Talpa occidentalis]|uniref:LOW QUALITY PROTEIN: putative taste receptor type 2 member 36 n=1 Tax=Talpa occidentalis TaxID=50954 RepID=UPI00188E4647|nr:LOW QUALITY PROTEIN: putative taste receptor type 2 member 36 [Talpa occidentalis]
MITLLLSIAANRVMLEFILGNLANGFIVLVNCIDWARRQRFSSVDVLLTALAVSRIGLLWDLFTLANFTPFTMSLVSFLLLIFSLWKHLKRMQLRHKGYEDPSTRIRIRSVQTMVSFLLLLASYFLVVIFTWGNKKLKQACVSFLRQLRYWLKERKWVGVPESMGRK